MRKRKRADSRGRGEAAVDVVRELIELRGTTLHGRTAITFVDSLGIIDRLSFAQLAIHVWRWSDLFGKREVGPGTRVAVMVAPSPEWYEVTLGLLKAGAVVVPAPPGLDARASEAFLRRLEPALVVAGPRAERVARRIEGVEVLGLSEADREMGTGRPAGVPCEAGESDLAFLLDGEPAAAAHTHASTLAAARQGGAWLDVSEADRVWLSEPPGSPVGLCAALGTWSRGAELVFSDGPFDPAETLNLVHRLGVTVLCQPAAELAAMAELPEAPLYDVSDIRRAVSEGVDDADARQAFNDVFGIPVAGGLVLAETGPIARAGPGNGQLSPLEGVELAILDADGEHVAEGETGFLAVRRNAPSLFAGYWNAPDATDDRVRGDWFLTSSRAAPATNPELSTRRKAEPPVDRLPVPLPVEEPVPLPGEGVFKPFQGPDPDQAAADKEKASAAKEELRRQRAEERAREAAERKAQRLEERRAREEQKRLEKEERAKAQQAAREQAALANEEREAIEAAKRAEEQQRKLLEQHARWQERKRKQEERAVAEAKKRLEAEQKQAEKRQRELEKRRAKDEADERRREEEQRERTVQAAAKQAEQERRKLERQAAHQSEEQRRLDRGRERLEREEKRRTSVWERIGKADPQPETTPVAGRIAAYGRQRPNDNGGEDERAS